MKQLEERTREMVEDRRGGKAPKRAEQREKKKGCCLAEVSTGRGSAGLVRGSGARCWADETSGKGKGKGNIGEGEHENKRRFCSK